MARGNQLRLPLGDQKKEKQSKESSNNLAEKSSKFEEVKKPLKDGNRIAASPAAKVFAQKAGVDLAKVKVIDPRGFITLANVKDFVLSSQGKPVLNEVLERRVNASPVAKRLADELGIDLSKMVGTGEGGRISREDVENFRAQSQPVIANLGEENKPQIRTLNRIKQTIAHRMSASKETIPHFYVTMEIEMGSALAVREDLKVKGKEISINDLVIRATAATLRQHPNLNAIFMENAIHQFPHVDMAIAVASPNGLITPVISRCEQLSLTELSVATQALIARTRAGNLTAEDLKMGTFTITNLGMYGIHDFAAIINPPQVAILAVGAVKRVPLFSSSGQLVAADLMNVTLSVDHRAADGAEASQFLKDLKLNLEEGFRTGKLN